MLRKEKGSTKEPDSLLQPPGNSGNIGSAACVQHLRSGIGLLTTGCGMIIASPPLCNANPPFAMLNKLPSEAG